jgi:hypothetical protein
MMPIVAKWWSRIAARLKAEFDFEGLMASYA